MPIQRPSRPDPNTMPSLYDGEGNVVQLKKLTHRHHAIMDYMLANPTLTLTELADHFHVTPAWLSTVRNSDLFQARLNERRQLMDEDQAYRLTQKLVNVAEKGIDAMVDTIEDEEIDGRTKLEVTKTALEGLGFLGKGKAAQAQPVAQPAAPTTVQVTVFEQAREKAAAGHQVRPALEHDNEK